MFTEDMLSGLESEFRDIIESAGATTLKINMDFDLLDPDDTGDYDSLICNITIQDAASAEADEFDEVAFVDVIENELSDDKVDSGYDGDDFFYDFYVKDTFEQN